MKRWFLYLLAEYVVGDPWWALALWRQ